MGRVTAATEVDHIDEDSHNNDPSNLQPLCKPCHSSKTAGRSTKGCDIDGRPFKKLNCAVQLTKS